MAIGHRATGTAVFDAATMSPVVPTAQVATDMMLLITGGKPYNRTATVATAGWNSLGTFSDGTTVVSGADTGSMIVEVWWKEATSDPETNPTITEGATAWDVVGGIVMCFSKSSTETWETPVMVGGGDATAGTGFSVTAGSNPGITAGDHCVTVGAFRSDAATPCSVHMTPTATSATFTNTHDPATDPESTTGFDMGMCITRSTLTGTASAAPVLAATLAAAHTGAAAFVRLRVRPLLTAAPADSVALSDSLTISWVQDRAGDTVTPSDSLSRVHIAARSVPDIVALTDNIDPVKSGATDHERDIDDTLALTDARTHARGLSLGTVDFGKPGLATFGTSGISANYAQVSSYTNPTAMLATSVRLYVHDVVTGQTQAVRGVVYADSGGNPGALLARTEEQVLTDAISATWVELLLPTPVALPAGTYWVGVHAGGPIDVSIIGAYDDVPSARKYRADNYADGTTTPFGTPDGTDTFQFSIYVHGGDGAALTDSLSPLTGKGVSVDDSLSLSDSLSRVMAYGRTQQDGLNLADQALDAQGLRLGDTLALADALARSRGLAKADSLALADARVMARAKVIADLLALTDEATPQKSGSGTQSVDDSIALADLFSRVATYARSVTDSVSLTDLFSSQKSKSVQVADTVTISDSFFRVATFLRSNPETLALTDEIVTARVHPMLLADLVELTDEQVVYNALITVLMDAIATGRIASGTLGLIERENGRIADTVSGTTESEGVQSGRITGAVGGVLEEVLT